MGRRKVATAKIVVVFLLAVIGERLATQLPAGVEGPYGVAAGFAGGVLAALVGSGAPPAGVIPATGLRRGGPIMVPEGWLRVVPPRSLR